MNIDQKIMNIANIIFASCDGTFVVTSKGTEFIIKWISNGHSAI